MKRLAVCLLTLCLFLSLVSLTASAEQVDGIYRYELMPDGTALLVGTTQKLSGQVHLPSTVGGHNVTAIGEDAFYGSENLISVTIPNGVTSLGEFSFAYCTGLESITLPNTLTAIQQGALMHCTALKELTIPASVTVMGIDAMDSLYSITSYHVESGSSLFEERDGVLFSVSGEDSNDGKTLLHYPAGRTTAEYKLPDDVVKIGRRSFNGSSHLTTIALNKQITFVEQEAFLNCPQLKTVTLPTSIQNIGEHAFGFTYVEGEAYVPVEGFILQGLADAKGQEYATNHDLHYQVLTAQQLTQILDPPTTPEPQTTSILDKLLAFAKQYQMWLIIGGGVLLLVIILLIVAKKKKH